MVGEKYKIENCIFISLTNLSPPRLVFLPVELVNHYNVVLLSAGLPHLVGRIKER